MTHDSLQQLLGSNQAKQQDYIDFLRRFQQDPGSISEEEASRRYRELVRSASPNAVAEAYQHVLGQLAPEQRQQLAQQYQQLAQQRRANAMQLAQLARQGATFPANASGKIRDALNDDITLWREQFQVDRKAWQAMRDQWLLDRSSLTPQQWALQRANWFAARDAWIANQKAVAMARRH